MGLAYNDLKYYRKAVECYKKAIEIDPECATAWYNMGVANLQLGNETQAMECFKKSNQIDLLSEIDDNIN